MKFPVGEVSVETRLECKPSFANGHDVVVDVVEEEDAADFFFVSFWPSFTSLLSIISSSSSISTTSISSLSSLPKMCVLAQLTLISLEA